LYLGHPDVLEDAVAARGFFVSAANLDDAGAMYNLGLIYLVGRGVTQDEIEAYKWFELSARAAVGPEHQNALGALRSLSERLTPVQVKIAMVAASDWVQASRHSALNANGRFGPRPPGLSASPLVGRGGHQSANVSGRD